MTKNTILKTLILAATAKNQKLSFTTDSLVQSILCTGKVICTKNKNIYTLSIRKRNI